MSTTVKLSNEETILEYLRKVKENIFNPKDVPVSLRILSQDTGVRQETVKSACLKLASEGRIEQIKAGEGHLYYRYINSF